MMQDAYHVYTDGSFTGYRNIRVRHANHRDCPKSKSIAGWGAAFFVKGPPPTETHDVIPGIGLLLTGEGFEGTLKGRVTNLKEAMTGAKGFVGTTKKSNNTAEAQAVVEVLLFLLTQLEAERPVLEPRAKIIIHSDSKYVVDSIRNGSRALRNVLIRDYLIHLWKRTREAYDIEIVWVRGHDNDVGNELADKLADEGSHITDTGKCSPWRPRDIGFHEFRRNFPSQFPRIGHRGQLNVQ